VTAIERANILPAMSDPSEAMLRAQVARRETILAQVRAVLTEDLRVPLPAAQIDPDTPMFGLGLALDSVDAVDLILGLEDRTGISLPDGAEATPYLRTVNTLVDFVLKAEAERSARDDRR
jgi:acyl carrier protein